MLGERKGICLIRETVHISFRAFPQIYYCHRSSVFSNYSPSSMSRTCPKFMVHRRSSRFLPTSTSEVFLACDAYSFVAGASRASREHSSKILGILAASLPDTALTLLDTFIQQVRVATLRTLTNHIQLTTSDPPKLGQRDAQLGSVCAVGDIICQCLEAGVNIPSDRVVSVIQTLLQFSQPSVANKHLFIPAVHSLGLIGRSCHVCLSSEDQEVS